MNNKLNISYQTHKIFTDGSYNKTTKRCGYGVFISDNNINNFSGEINKKKN